jgi:hypothetical protein
MTSSPRFKRTFSALLSILACSASIFSAGVAKESEKHASAKPGTAKHASGKPSTKADDRVKDQGEQPPNGADKPAQSPPGAPAETGKTQATQAQEAPAKESPAKVSAPPSTDKQAADAADSKASNPATIDGISSEVRKSCTVKFDEAMRMRSEGRMKEAEVLLQDVLKQSEQNLDNIRYNESLYALYSIYKNDSRWGDAIALFTESLKADARDYPGHLADTASDYLEMAECEYNQKHFKEAADYYAQSLSLREKVYGPKSPYVGAVRWRYARTLKAMGQTAKAAEQLKESYTSLPMCPKCKTNEGMCPIRYGQKSYLFSPREDTRMDYFDGGRILTAQSKHFWCTKCSQRQ